MSLTYIHPRLPLIMRVPQLTDGARELSVYIDMPCRRPFGLSLAADLPPDVLRAVLDFVPFVGPALAVSKHWRDVCLTHADMEIWRLYAADGKRGGDAFTSALICGESPKILEYKLGRYTKKDLDLFAGKCQAAGHAGLETRVIELSGERGRAERAENMICFGMIDNSAGDICRVFMGCMCTTTLVVAPMLIEFLKH